MIKNLNDDSNEASEASACNFFYKYAIYYQRAKFMMLHNWDTLSDLYQALPVQQYLHHFSLKASLRPLTTFLWRHSSRYTVGANSESE